MNAVQSGGGINEAAQVHGVPSSTLKDRISTEPGPKPYLTNSEEHELGCFLKECAGIGQGETSCV